MTSKTKILVSGVKPTGRPHIGNYFGAMKQFVELQNTHDCFVFIADLHALTSLQNKEELSQNIINVAIDYLAIGLDPKKTTIFKQSDIAAHSELAWVFNCITTMPYLMRSHAYKDALAKNKEINVGVFDYPMLMAADILLYSPNVVPVGQDQKQHVEYTRDTALKFNRIFGETFVIPEPLIYPDVGIVPGTDGEKMSKSHNNIIGLFATDDEIRNAVMSIPTDSRGLNDPLDPETCKVFALHKFFNTKEELDSIREQYLKGGLGYKGSKDLLVKKLVAFISPLREKRAEFAAKSSDVLKILKKGSDEARKIANEKMDEVRERIGLKIY